MATDAGSVSDQTARFVNKSHLLPYLCIATLTRHECFNLSKPNGYVMHQQFNIQQLYFLPTQCIYVFCIYLRTNSDLCHLQHKMFGFCNRDGKCLLCGTNWVFKYSSLRLAFKELISGEEPPYQPLMRLGGPQNRSGRLEEQKNILPVLGIEPRNPQESSTQPHHRADQLICS